MITKEELLNDKNIFKSFKNGEELTSFFSELHKKAIEQMLNGELDGHLDNQKHDKRIKTSLGDSIIKFPRDRDSSFEPKLVPKRKSIIEGLENIIISFYAKGI